MGGLGRRGQRGARRATVVALALVAGLAVGTPDVRASSTVPAGFRVAAAEFVDTGVSHEVLRRADPAQEVHVARVDPGLAGRLRVVTARDLVGGGTETVSGICLRLRCRLAVNADYTDLGGGPVGSAVAAGELLRSPGIRMGLFSLDAAGRPAIDHALPWSAELGIEGEDPVAIAAVNRPRSGEGIMLYTPRFGPSTRTGSDGRELVLQVVGGTWGGPVPAGGVAVRLAELTVGGDTALTPDRVVLSARGEGRERLEALWHAAATTGERDAVLRVGTGGLVEVVGGSPTLVREGRRELADNPDDFTRGRHPRTVVGWTASGELLLVSVDGRQPGHGAGMTLAEASDLLLGLGAVEALNLDGGGSTTFVVNTTVVNRPSDGRERPVTSALVLLPAPGTVATASPRAAEEACPPRSVPPSGFSDVPATDHHGAAIDCAVWWRLTAGAGGGTYDPTGVVTRAQLASFVTRLVLRTGGVLPDAPPDRYPDDQQSVHARSIDRLAAVGIVAGRGDGTFGPDEPVTRGQMASLLVRALEHRTGAPLPGGADYFADDANDVHEGAINRLALAGLTGGRRHPHLFAPGDLVQRDQMASFLTRTTSVLVAQGHTPAHE